MPGLVKQLAVGGFDHNFSYLLIAGNGDAALVDPAGDAEIIRRAAAAAGKLNCRWILLTHGHRDHFQALTAVREFFPAPVIAHPEHPEAEKRALADGQEIPFGEGVLKVIFTPGHTMDSVSFLWPEAAALFTGDTLFIGCIGFCCNEPAMYRSLKEKLLPLPGNLMIYSGHDYGPVRSRTLDLEKRNNPFLPEAGFEAFQQQLKKLD